MAGTSCRNLQVLANYASFKRDENSARSFAYGVTPTAVFFIFPIMYASLSYMSFYRLHCFSNLHMFLAFACVWLGFTALTSFAHCFWCYLQSDLNTFSVVLLNFFAKARGLNSYNHRYKRYGYFFHNAPFSCGI